MMRKASSASASKTTNEILTLDAPWLSISTFTPRCASTVKTRAINSVERATSAMKLTIAHPSLTSTRAMSSRRFRPFGDKNLLDSSPR